MLQQLIEKFNNKKYSIFCLLTDIEIINFNKKRSKEYHLHSKDNLICFSLRLSNHNGNKINYDLKNQDSLFYKLSIVILEDGINPHNNKQSIPIETEYIFNNEFSISYIEKFIYKVINLSRKQLLADYEIKRPESFKKFINKNIKNSETIINKNS